MHQEIELMEENADSLFHPLGLGKRKEEQGFRMHLATKLLKIYPNPSNDYITLQYRTGTKYNKLWFEISDTKGSVLIKHNLLGGDNEELINTSTLKPNIYTLLLYADGERIAVEKITVIK